MKNSPTFLKGMAIAGHIFGYIAGPLIILGGLGLWIDTTYDKKPIFTIIALISAMLISNYLIFKRTLTVFQKYLPQPPKEETKDQDQA